MSSDAPNSSHQAVSLLLYIAILSLFVLVIAWDTEWRAVDRNQYDAVLSDCAHFIVASLVLTLILT